MNPFQIPEMAKQYTDYDMIQAHTELPEFPLSRTRLLCAFLQEPESADGHRDLYALATSLVQMGIDTHELVTETNEVKEKKAVRARQLKVLAGDYFSSRFYHLLSQAGQIDMVRQLSAAICEVNRLKMTLYMRMKQLKLSAEEYIQAMVDIRSQLFLHYSRLMQGVQNRLWPEILNGFAQCEVLAGELSRIEKLHSFKGSWGYWFVLQNSSPEERKELDYIVQDEGALQSILHKYNIKNQLSLMLEQQIHQVLDKAKQLNSDKLLQELTLIGEPFFQLVRQPKVAEEH